MPVFALPLALTAAAVALPSLVAIYWLRNRFRRQPVSSLMLWLDHRKPTEGGSLLQRLRTPLMFLLEMLIIALLVLAAAGPKMMLRPSDRPLMVVLDDSLSMQAGRSNSARDRAVEVLEDELQQRGVGRVRFIVAGLQPQVLGPAVHSRSHAMEILDRWQPDSAASDLPSAMSLASRLGGEQARILVMTDHVPPDDLPLDRSRFRWWAFGDVQSNLAIVSAARSTFDNTQRVLIEVQNLSPAPRRTALRLIGNGQTLRNIDLQLGAGQVHRMTLSLTEQAGLLTAELDDDALAADNTIALLPVKPRPVRVALNITDESLAQSLRQAVDATGLVDRSAGPAHLRITDATDPVNASPPTWSLVVHRAEHSSAYIGPFVIDQSHPLAAGLSMEGVVWSAGGRRELPGVPVIMAGSVPLLTDAVQWDGRHNLHMQLRADLSTLVRSPNWPALMWNLLHWRSRHLPGIADPNVRLGTSVRVALPPGAVTAQLIDPPGSVQNLRVAGDQLELPADTLGVHQLRILDAEERLLGEESFVVNALSRDESNLVSAAEGRWGDWADEQALRAEYQPIAWMLLLGAVGVFAWHQWLIARQSGGSRL